MRDYVMVWLTSLVVVAAATERCRADEDFSLVINPFTGAASLRNDGIAPVAIDSYLITSAGATVLNPAGWNSLDDNSVPGWQETTSAGGNRLGELNLFQSLTIGAGQSVGIGNPYTPFSPSTFGAAEPGLSALNFAYTRANEGQARIGDVEFSRRNTVVLVIDAATGAAELQNQSAFNVNIDSYLIKSSANVIDVAGWTPLADGNPAWRASSGAANRVAEGNLFGSTFLAANGGSLPIGNPIDPGLLNDETDLALEFTIVGAPALVGGVLFEGSVSSGFDADFDADGDVDGADLVIWRSGFGDPGGRAEGDANGNNFVDGHDFLIWQRQLGAGPGTTAVPEPTMSLSVATMLLVACGKLRHGRRFSGA